ncbi:MAG: PAS domain S-box protein [Candidatus Binatia bacterium]|nr:PAS domain S-box protein [Candidatus Binatia bacterium]
MPEALELPGSRLQEEGEGGPEASQALSVVRVLVVEDNPVYARVVRAWLESATEPGGQQYLVTIAESLASAAAALQQASFDAILLDLMLPDCPREETLTRVRALSVAPIIVLSSVREAEAAIDSLRRGAQDYLVKGQVDADRLLRSLRYAIHRHALERELRRQNQALRALSECNQLVGSALTEEALYADVCKVIVRRAGYRFAWIGLVQPASPPWLQPVAWHGFAPSYLDGIRITIDDSATGRGPAARAIRFGRSQRVSDVVSDPLFVPWRERAIRHGYRSLIALPLVVQGRAIGALCVYSAQADAFGSTAAELLEELVANLAVGVERLRAREERDRAERERREAESRFRLLAEMSPVGVVCGLADGRCLYVNDRACEILGWPREELLGTGWQRFICEKDRSRLLEEWLAWGSRPVAATEFRFRRESGELIWLNLQVAMVHGREAGGLVVVGTVMDVTARRRAEHAVEEMARNLEKMVIERTRQLENAVREIESFNHSLAHDIRGPLRRVVAYCELLKLRCAPQLSPQAVQYVSLIRSNAAHLDRLVDDLLNLARVRTHPLRCREVDLSETSRRILRSLAEAHPDRQVEFAVAEGVRAWADPNLLEVLLGNLLENAWKYTQSREIARIEFGVEQVGSEHAYYVRDNGCGFEPEYADELFKPFTRFASGDGFEGTGIGLATVQRIVARHGGRVWAQGVPGKGATFYFTLPPQN